MFIIYTILYNTIIYIQYVLFLYSSTLDIYYIDIHFSQLHPFRKNERKKTISISESCFTLFIVWLLHKTVACSRQIKYYPMRMMNSWPCIANEVQMRCGRMVLLYKQQWEVDKWGCLAVLHALLLNHHVARESYRRGITALAIGRTRLISKHTLSMTISSVYWKCTG